MPTLVLLPGLDGTGHLFADFLTALGPKIMTRTASYPSNLSLGYGELESIARTFVPNGEPYVLLAESFSGPIAISIASSKPPGLLALILCCSFAAGPRGWRRDALRIFKGLPLKSIPTLLIASVLLGRFSSKGRRTALAAALKEVNWKALHSRIESILRVDVTRHLGQVDVPILCLRATEDRLVTRAQFEEVERKNPRVSLAELPGPHLLLQALPNESAEIVRDFLTTLRQT